MKNSQVCRCCLSEACYKDISNEYIHNGKKEVYAAMLVNVFNINISYQDDSSRLICEDCIIRLREAAAFRAQVERTEDVIKGRCFESHGAEPTKLLDIKDDFLDHITGIFDDENGDEQSNDDFNWQDDCDEKGNVYVIKMEGEDNLTTLDDVDAESSDVLKRESVTKDKKRKLTDIDKPEKESKKRLKSQSQIERKETSLKLINNSNICLFESLKTKFRCFYCKNSYLTMNELREHTKTHSNLSYLKMCINRMQGMSFKNVDISNLTCKICQQALTNLTDLQTHLIQRHEMRFPGNDHMLIPYRLDEGFNCVLCDQKHNTFFRLSIHMNSHYTNNVCEICGVSYINRLSLRMHVNSIHKEKKCTLCPAVFSNTYARIKHMRKVHNSSEAKRYCLLCDKTFRYTYMLNEHKIREHGMKRQVAVCQECGKSFLTAVNLRTHIRSVHIKERNHPCNYCGMSFFTSCDQRRHERTHQDVRLFACIYCEGRFKSKDSLRRHLKRQHSNLFVVHSEHM